MCIYTYIHDIYNWWGAARGGENAELPGWPGRVAVNSCLHFSICAWHPCAGAMLIFSVSFQVSRSNCLNGAAWADGDGGKLSHYGGDQSP